MIRFTTWFRFGSLPRFMMGISSTIDFSYCNPPVLTGKVQDTPRKAHQYQSQDWSSQAWSKFGAVWPHHATRVFVGQKSRFVVSWKKKNPRFSTHLINTISKMLYIFLFSNVWFTTSHLYQKSAFSFNSHKNKEGMYANLDPSTNKKQLPVKLAHFLFNIISSPLEAYKNQR